MKTPLAWRNVVHSRWRSFAALCGISFAIVLIFMQLGFYASAKRSATMLFGAMDFDLLLVSPEYLFVARTGTFPLNRLEEMRAIPGVESVAPVWQSFGEWRTPETRLRWGVLMLGVDPERPVFRSPAMAAQMESLRIPDNALFDTLSRPEFGVLQPGVATEINHRRVRLVGNYTIGTGFVAGASIIASQETLRRISGTDREMVSLGLVRLKKGASPTEVARQINAISGSEFRAVTRAEIYHAEETFWLNVKPIGIMFTSGVLIAFIVGVVILYQVLASEVQNRLREYATLKALGYSNGYVIGVIICYQILYTDIVDHLPQLATMKALGYQNSALVKLVLKQALLLGILGFIPAILMTFSLYSLLTSITGIVTVLTLSRVLLVLTQTLGMCLVSGLLAVRRALAVDPADLV